MRLLNCYVKVLNRKGSSKSYDAAAPNNSFNADASIAFLSIIVCCDNVGGFMHGAG